MVKMLNKIINKCNIKSLIYFLDYKHIIIN